MLIKHAPTIFIILSGLSLFYSCNTNHKNNFISTNSHRTAKSADSIKNDSIAMAQIEKLPEFKKLRERFNNLNHDTSNHFLVMVAEEPDTALKYYWVKVGEANPNSFHAWAHFYVDPKNLAVSYYDTVSDSLFTLEEWRKSGKYDLLR